MILHESRVDFNEAVVDTAAHFGINDLGIVEKDYFVTLFLKHLASRQHDLIFKGGTCLSKAYKVINRFSEDIRVIMRYLAALTKIVVQCTIHMGDLSVFFRGGRYGNVN